MICKKKNENLWLIRLHNVKKGHLTDRILPGKNPTNRRVNRYLTRHCKNWPELNSLLVNTYLNYLLYCINSSH